MRLLVASLMVSGCAGTQYLIPAQLAPEVGVDHEESPKKSAIEAVRLPGMQPVFVDAGRLRDARPDGSGSARVRSKQSRLTGVATLLLVLGAGAIVGGGFAIADGSREQRLEQQECAANPGFFCGFGAGVGASADYVVGGFVEVVGGVLLIASFALYALNARERPELPAGRRGYTYLRAPSWQPDAPVTTVTVEPIVSSAPTKPTSPEPPHGHDDVDAWLEH